MMYLVRGVILLCLIPALCTITLVSASSQWYSGYQDMLNQVNKQRAASNLQPLCISDSLMASALKHSQYQASISTMTHDGTNSLLGRFSEQGFHPQSGAENVGYSSNMDITAIMNGWMGDDGHKGNILGNYKFFGSAVVKDSKGKYYWTQHFASTLDPNRDKCSGGSPPAGVAPDSASTPSPRPTSAASAPASKPSTTASKPSTTASQPSAAASKPSTAAPPPPPPPSSPPPKTFQQAGEPSSTEQPATVLPPPPPPPPPSEESLQSKTISREWPQKRVAIKRHLVCYEIPDLECPCGCGEKSTSLPGSTAGCTMLSSSLSNTSSTGSNNTSQNDATYEADEIIDQ